MKTFALVFAPLIFVIGCAAAPLPDRANASLQAKANPTYPAYAARNGIEGYVQMRFDIDEDGEPVNIKVINAVPEKIFDQAAIKALANWRYAPKVVNGVAVVQKDLVVRLDFNMG